MIDKIPRPGSPDVLDQSGVEINAFDELYVQKVAQKIPRHNPLDVLDRSGIEVNTFDELYAQEVAQQTIYSDHRASFFHVIRYRGTGNSHWIEDRRIALEGDCLLVLNKDILHRYSKYKCHGELILFMRSFFTQSEEKSCFINNCSILRNNYMVISLHDELFAAQVDAYISLMRRESKGENTHQVVMCNLLHNLLITVEREHLRQGGRLVETGENCGQMQLFRALLDEHYRTQKQVAFYAGQLSVDESKLSRMVRTAHGISAKDYISEKVLLEAIRLLENTTLNQGEIAAELGFDLTYFIKFFRHRTGVTPAKYRKSV
ncbi:hypothetical protein FACS1894159_07970 [Bacteroidia bacterium]|nr:hypothetical protein FACS1894159_07970 [Bacteroidia bacterium]